MYRPTLVRPAVWLVLLVTLVVLTLGACGGTGGGAKGVVRRQVPKEGSPASSRSRGTRTLREVHGVRIAHRRHGSRDPHPALRGNRQNDANRPQEGAKDEGIDLR